MDERLIAFQKKGRVRRGGTSKPVIYIIGAGHEVAAAKLAVSLANQIDNKSKFIINSVKSIDDVPGINSESFKLRFDKSWLGDFSIPQDLIAAKSRRKGRSWMTSAIIPKLRKPKGMKYSKWSTNLIMFRLKMRNQLKSNI